MRQIRIIKNWNPPEKFGLIRVTQYLKEQMLIGENRPDKISIHHLNPMHPTLLNIP